VRARYFEYLLGRFTEPNEIFGPIDLRKLREGVVETQTEGMLPEAEIAFLDEVFLGSTAILNTLLGLLNERTFRRGHTHRQVPLRVCVGASNALPEDESLGAFADRFLLRVFVNPIPDARLEDLLEATMTAPAQGAAAELADLDVLAEAASRMDVRPVHADLARAVRLLRSEGVAMSDRRVVKLQRLVASAAALDGRTCPTPSDLWPVVYTAGTEADQRIARRCLEPIVADARNRTLAGAAAWASRGRAARAEEIRRSAERLFADEPPAEARSEWRLRLEGLAREIDVLFAPDERPAELSAVRAEIAERVAPAS
jgi:MoxR-like ATPase